jgi:hypothetical protein
MRNTTNRTICGAEWSYYMEILSKKVEESYQTS